MNQHYQNINNSPKNNNAKLIRYSNLYSNLQSRLSINQKINNEKRTIKANITFKENQITQQVKNQIKLIEECLKNNFSQLMSRKMSRQNTIKTEIFQIQDFIKQKDIQIKQITQEIKYLKINNNNIEINPNQSNNNEDSHSYDHNSINSSTKKTQTFLNQHNLNLMFKLAQELKDQRNEMIKYFETHTKKYKQLKQMKEKIIRYEQKYIQKCRQTKQRPLRYEEFKQLNEEKKKKIKNKSVQNNIKPHTIINSITNNINVNNSHSSSNRKLMINNINKNINSIGNANNKKNSSIYQSRDFVFSNYQNSNVGEGVKNQNSSGSHKKTLKQLQNKKNIAEQALKNSKKKHDHQLNQLMAKIQFLRDQDMTLFEKIKQKQEEKIYLQAKFNQATKNVKDIYLHRKDSSRNSSRNLGLSLSRKQLLSSRHYIRQPVSPGIEQNFSQRKNSYPKRLLSAKEKSNPKNSFFEYYDDKHQQ